MFHIIVFWACRESRPVRSGEAPPRCADMSYLSVQLFPAKTGLAWAAVQLAGRGPVLAGCLVSLSLLFFE